MSVEFRQRKPAEYLKILWRRKWAILLPALAVTVAVAWAVWKLPNVYESTTLLTVRPASISTNIVPQLSDNDLTFRINNISQEVMSRSTLEPLITRYDLYARERARGEAMENLVERMRTQDIRVTLNTSREVTNGFYLSFRGPDPRVTQAVTAELARKYVEAQTRAAVQDADITNRFFEEKVAEAKSQLDAIDNRRLQFMQTNLSSLPESGASLLGQLEGLRNQQQTLRTEIGRMRDQRNSLSNLIANLDKAQEQEIDNVITAITDPKTTVAYAELVKRKTELEAHRRALLNTYTKKHPDVILVDDQIAALQKQLDDAVAEHERKVEEQRQRLTGRVNPTLNQYRDNIRSIDNEIARQERILAQTDGQIGAIESRLNSVPGVQVGLEAINREYQSAKGVYDQMLAQSEKAKLAAAVTGREQGETITVLDSANLPAQPVAPKRPLLMLLGLAAGLGFGLFLAAAFEFPRLLTVQTSEDAEHYTGLPVLASLPSLMTPRERRGLKLRRAAFGVAGVAAAVFAVPALYFILTRLHIIEMLA
jgi:polysaccharide biosynthesis transport protein